MVMAASTVMRLQTIASREVDPTEACVVTAGALNTGDVEKVIPAYAHLKLNVNTFTQEQRSRVLARIKRTVSAKSMASNAPESAEVVETSSFPLTSTDHDVTAKLGETLLHTFPQLRLGIFVRWIKHLAVKSFSLLGSSIDQPYNSFV